MNEFGVKCVRGGWIFAISLPKSLRGRWHGCRNAGFGLNSTNSLFPDRVKPYPSKQKKGGWNIALKGLCVWACFLGQNGAFLETLEIRFLATTWVLRALQHAPKACLVQYDGQECWVWAVVGSESWDFYPLSTLVEDFRPERQSIFTFYCRTHCNKRAQILSSVVNAFAFHGSISLASWDA